MTLKDVLFIVVIASPSIGDGDTDTSYCTSPHVILGASHEILKFVTQIVDMFLILVTVGRSEKHLVHVNKFMTMIGVTVIRKWLYILIGFCKYLNIGC